MQGASAPPPAVALPDLASHTGLPEPLARWTRELLEQDPPAERHATCEACAMCGGGAGPSGTASLAPPGRLQFSPDTRCCTYRPALVNHLAGRMRREPGWRAQLELRIAAGEATPMGVRVDPRTQLLYRHAAAPAFGRAQALRCPHLAPGGGCGIWAHRPAVCATWFCKHERGAVGQRLWHGLRDCLVAAERVLALWCLDQLGFDGHARREAMEAFDADRFDAAALDQRPDPEQARRLWGPWLGRELECYEACADRVASMDWATVERLGGADLAMLAARVREAARAHGETALPERLEVGRFSVTGAARGRLCLSTYSEFDPLELDPAWMSLVARCDGRPWPQIEAEQRAAGQAVPPLRMLRVLVDHGVLKAVG